MMVSRSQGAPGISVYPHHCFRKASWAVGSKARRSAMVRDSASEDERRYLAVNSYLPRYCSMRKGAICMGEVCQDGGGSSRTKLSGGDKLECEFVGIGKGPEKAGKT